MNETGREEGRSQYDIGILRQVSEAMRDEDHRFALAHGTELLKELEFAKWVHR